MIQKIIILSFCIHLALSACTTSSVDTAGAGTGADGFSAGKCCQKAAAGTATYVKDTDSVKTCPTATAGDVGEVAPTDCKAGHGLVSGACVACAIGTYNADGNTGACLTCASGSVSAAKATSCTACTANTYAATPAAATCANCALGSVAAASATACTACAAGQYTQNDGTCADRDAGAAAITNCQVYAAATAGNCLVANDGYKTITTAGGDATVPDANKCFANCKTCSDTTETTCSVPMAGYYINDFDVAAKQVVACSTDSLCSECTFVKGTTATNGQVSCTKAQSGAYLDKTTVDAVVAKACAAGKGSPVDNTGELVSCVDCDKTTAFCSTCQATAFCTACLPGYVLTATTGVCAAYTGKVDGTCEKANAEGNSACQSCKSADNREMQDDDASTATPQAKLMVGKCVCKSTFGDKSGLSTPDFKCAECGAGVATCTFTAAGMTVDSCLSGNYKVGTTACKAKDATDVVGHYWVAADSAFKPCHATCRTCTAATATTCATCYDAPSTWVEPTSTATNYATYIKGTRALINATCFGDCPSGFIANTARTSCVAGTASGGTAAAGTASGVFAIFALIASLLIIF